MTELFYDDVVVHVNNFVQEVAMCMLFPKLAGIMNVILFDFGQNPSTGISLCTSIIDKSLLLNFFLIQVYN